MRPTYPLHQLLVFIEGIMNHDPQSALPEVPWYLVVTLREFYAYRLRAGCNPQALQIGQCICPREVRLLVPADAPCHHATQTDALRPQRRDNVVQRRWRYVT